MNTSFEVLANAPLTKWMAVHFDTEEYLRLNPDLSEAGVRSDDQLVNHFVHHGFVEGRAYGQSRRDRVLAGLDLEQPSLELGPLTTPLLARGHPAVKFADHASTKDIVEKYENDANVDVNDVVDIDYVIDGSDMAATFGADTKFSIIVASHVIEHVPDLIGWLNSLVQILARDGEIRLVIPDKRFTFDILRECSEFADVVGPYFSKPTRPQPAQLFDHYANFTKIDAAEAWMGSYLYNRPQRARSEAEALKLVSYNVQSTDYADAHCWIFTPLSFLDLFLRFVKLGLCQFKCAHFSGTTAGSNEFVVGLTPSSDLSEAIRSWEIAPGNRLAGGLENCSLKRFQP